MRIQTSMCRFLVAAVLLVLAMPAHANVMIPTLFVTWPMMVLALIPVAVIEALTLTSLLGVGLVAAATASITANVISTLLGIPIAWLLFVMLIPPLSISGISHTNRIGAGFGKRFSEVLLYTQFVPPRDAESDRRWALPLACIVLLVPYFLASWLIERWIAAWVLESISPLAVSDAVFRANALTYSLLALLIGLIAVADIVKAARATRFTPVAVRGPGLSPKCLRRNVITAEPQSPPVDPSVWIERRMRKQLRKLDRKNRKRTDAASARIVLAPRPREVLVPALERSVIRQT